jgi:hypothetical protein
VLVIQVLFFPYDQSALIFKIIRTWDTSTALYAMCTSGEHLNIANRQLLGPKVSVSTQLNLSHELERILTVVQLVLSQIGICLLVMSCFNQVLRSNLQSKLKKKVACIGLFKGVTTGRGESLGSHVSSSSM